MAIITNLYEAHLDYHETRRIIYEAKTNITIIKQKKIPYRQWRSRSVLA